VPQARLQPHSSQKVYLASEKRLETILDVEASEGANAGCGIELDEQADVSGRALLAAGKRAEERERGHAKRAQLRVVGGQDSNDVIADCGREKITFTRGRAYKKNDRCFVEQKNGSIVRQLVGYDRCEDEVAYGQLGELYRALNST
jgi:hypothetical protein